MKEKYKAVEVSIPGVLRVVERPVSEPGAGQVRIRVEACGVCHSDAATVTGTYPDLNLVVGVPQDLMQLNAFPLVFGGRSVYGALTGTAIETEDTLAFSVLENIRPMIETVPLEQAADAYARMMQGKARFRMVLVTKNGASASAPVN